MNKRAFYFLLVSLLFSSYTQSATIFGSFQQINGSPFAAGINPLSIAYSPIASGNLFLAISNFDTISVYLINQSTGALTQVAGSPFATGTQAQSIAFSPIASGNLFAAVISFNGDTISVYKVNQSTGVFTEVDVLATGADPFSIAFSPIVEGNLFVAVTNTTAHTVSVYEVNQTSGALTLVGPPVTTGAAQPQVISFSPVVDGNLFAAVTGTNNTVTVYEVNQTTGVFTQIAGSPFATGPNPVGISYSPLIEGNLFVAVVNSGDNTISVSKVNQTTGVFTQIAGSPFSTQGTGAQKIAFSPVVLRSFLFAAVTNFITNDVAVFQVNPTTGVFTPVTGSPFATAPGTGPIEIAYSPLVDNNLFAATSNFSSDNTSVYKVVIPIDRMWLACLS